MLGLSLISGNWWPTTVHVYLGQMMSSCVYPLCQQYCFCLKVRTTLAEYKVYICEGIKIISDVKTLKTLIISKVHCSLCATCWACWSWRHAQGARWWRTTSPGSTTPPRGTPGRLPTSWPRSLVLAAVGSDGQDLSTMQIFPTLTTSLKEFDGIVWGWGVLHLGTLVIWKCNKNEIICVNTYLVWSLTHFKDKAIFTIQSSVKIICVDEDNVECTVIIDIDIFYFIDSLSNFIENFLQ